MKLKTNNRAGFTLIEIMLVVVIIGLLVTVVSVNITKQSKSAKIVAAQNQIHGYGLGLSTFQLDNGFYPTSQQGLEALVSPPSPAPPKWNGPYLNPAIVRPDPWGRAYVYASPPSQNPDADSYDLYSVGADGQPGTDDDVVSWR